MSGMVNGPDEGSVLVYVSSKRLPFFCSTIHTPLSKVKFRQRILRLTVCQWIPLKRVKYTQRSHVIEAAP